MKSIGLLITSLLCAVLCYSEPGCPDNNVIYLHNFPLNFVCNTDDLKELKFSGALLNGSTPTLYGGTHKFQWEVVSGYGAITVDYIGATTGATYTISAKDYEIAIVKVKLTTTLDDKYSCSQMTFDTTYTMFLMSYAVNAGPDQTLCKSQSENVSVKSVTTKDNFIFSPFVYQWSTMGTGSFKNNSKASAEYIPSELDKSSGTVKLVSKVQKNFCMSNDYRSDTIELRFINNYSIEAGENQTICREEELTSLLEAKVSEGNVSGLKYIYQWSSEDLGVFDDPDKIKSMFTPSAQELDNGEAHLTVKVRPEVCIEEEDFVSDDLVIIYTVCSSQKNQNPDNEIIVYPIPATDHLIIQGGQWKTGQLKIYSVEGEIVEDVYIENGNKIIFNLVPGMYYALLESENVKFSKVFLVK